MNFSNVYKVEDFYTKYPHKIIDLSNLEGTNCYCDDDAAIRIKEAIANEPIDSIHFIDSGNYHYISKLWTDRIKEPFNLLVFDHHTDIQEPQFGDILSCGGWIKKVLDENPFINRVTIVGVREDLALQIPDIYHSKVDFIVEDDISKATLPSSKLPCFISIDKDAINEDEARTNWDQGRMKVNDIVRFISAFSNKDNILGIDICGEPDFESLDNESCQINVTTNSRLIDLINEIK